MLTEPWKKANRALCAQPLLLGRAAVDMRQSHSSKLHYSLGIEVSPRAASAHNKEQLAQRNLSVLAVHSLN
eukprot:4386132-Pleurochrysis_carterae.AAC.3